MALAFAAVGLLAFAGQPRGEQAWDLSQWEPAVFLYLLLFFVAGGLVYAGALNMVGCMCRKGLDRVRVSLWLPFWLWVCGWPRALLGGVVTLGSGGGFEWAGLLVGALFLALVSFGVILPFLILSFACPFYRERLKSLLRLPAPECSPAAPRHSRTQPVKPQALREQPRRLRLHCRFLRDDDGIHRLVLARQGNFGEARGLQVLPQFGKRERAAAFGGHEHVHGKQRARYRAGAVFLHQDVADGDAPARGQRRKDLAEQGTVLGPRILVHDGAHPRQVRARRQAHRA